MFGNTIHRFHCAHGWPLVYGRADSMVVYDAMDCPGVYLHSGNFETDSLPSYILPRLSSIIPRSEYQCAMSQGIVALLS